MNLDHLAALAKAAGGGTIKGDWESTGVVIAAPDQGGMEYLLETVAGEDHPALAGEDHPALAFVEAANPNAILAMIEELRALRPVPAGEASKGGDHG